MTTRPHHTASSGLYIRSNWNTFEDTGNPNRRCQLGADELGRHQCGHTVNCLLLLHITLVDICTCWRSSQSAMLRSAAFDICNHGTVGSLAFSKQQVLHCRISLRTAQPLSRRNPGRRTCCRGVHCAAWQRPTVRHVAQSRRPRTSALADASMQPGQTAPADETADDNFLVARVRGALRASWLSIALTTTQRPAALVPAA